MNEEIDNSLAEYVAKAERDALRRYESYDGPGEMTRPLPDEWVDWFLRQDRTQQLKVAEHLLRMTSESTDCLLRDHEGRIAELAERVAELEQQIEYSDVDGDRRYSDEIGQPRDESLDPEYERLMRKGEQLLSRGDSKRGGYSGGGSAADARPPRRT